MESLNSDSCIQSDIVTTPSNPDALCHRIPMYYINLDRRPDRNGFIQQEFNRMGCNPYKIHRIAGHDFRHAPQLGCALSHIQALETFMDHPDPIAIICEDDFTTQEHITTFEKILHDLSRLDPQWSVLQLSSVHYSCGEPLHDNIYRVQKADTTTGYVVNKKSAPVLIHVFKWAAKNLYQHQGRTLVGNPFAIDIAWQKVQPRMNWYILDPCIAQQNPALGSDIDGQRF